jgi:hypothetical protein
MAHHRALGFVWKEKQGSSVRKESTAADPTARYDKRPDLPNQMPGSAGELLPGIEKSAFSTFKWLTDAGVLVRYSIPAGGAQGPFQVEAELWYQPIGFRWAHNLSTYGAEETRRSISYQDSMPCESAIVRSRSVGNR